MWTKTVSELGGEKSVFIYVPDVLDTSMQGLFLELLDSQNDFKNNKNYNEDKIIRKQKWYQKNGQYFTTSFYESVQQSPSTHAIPYHAFLLSISLCYSIDRLDP